MYQPTNNFEHYLELDQSDRLNNYRTGSQGTYLAGTNIPACHGTSGSGAFVGGYANDPDPRLLGPAVSGDSWVVDHLCARYDSASGNQLTYTKRNYTHIYEDWVAWDR